MNPEPLECIEHFGYLSEREKGEEIPEKCIICQKSTDCMLCNLQGEIMKIERTDKKHAKGKIIHQYGAILQPQRLPSLESLLNPSASRPKNNSKHTTHGRNIAIGRKPSIWNWIKL